jgi:hypothetical protein
MLASILPGLREARVPLAAGVLWVIAFAISLSWGLPLIEPTLLLEQLDPLGGALGGAAILAGVAFGSYLVGVMVLSLPVFREHPRDRDLADTSLSGLDGKILRELRAARSRGVGFDRVVSQFPELQQMEESRFSGDDREMNADSMRANEEPQSGRSLDELADFDRWWWLETFDSVTHIRRRVLDELELAELSLQATTRDVYDKYDRGRAEGEFRRGVAPALVAIFVALSVRLAVEYGSWWPILGFLIAVPAGLLWLSGNQHLARARNLMIQAVLGGQAISPTLKLIADLQPPVGRV